MRSTYQEAARQTTAFINGDGIYALHCEALNEVWLYSHYMFAMAEVARDHGNRRCKNTHSLVELEPAPPRPAIRNRALMERD